MRIVWIVVFLLGLFYLILPGPTKISDFPPLPESLKSTEEGDTWQNPNNSAYFSDWWRSDVTTFYKIEYQKLNCPENALKVINPLCYIPPIRLNRPPEEAYQYIRDQQQSTYLEEYLYPFRDSIFVNGFEPFDKNNQPFQRDSTNLVVDEIFYNSKTTLRYYPSSVAARVLIYAGVWIAVLTLFVLTKKTLKNK